VDLTVGPVIEEGFYYDCFMGEGRGTLQQEEVKSIASKMDAVAKEAQQFQRVEVTRKEAKDMFKENRFKVLFPSPPSFYPQQHCRCQLARGRGHVAGV
jgi:threonyl-tRNA synthetase